MQYPVSNPVKFFSFSSGKLSLANISRMCSDCQMAIYGYFGHLWRSGHRTECAKYIPSLGRAFKLSNRKNKNCSGLLMPNRMGLHRAPSKFLPLKFAYCRWSPLLFMNTKLMFVNTKCSMPALKALGQGQKSERRNSFSVAIKKLIPQYWTVYNSCWNSCAHKSSLLSHSIWKNCISKRGGGKQASYLSLAVPRQLSICFHSSLRHKGSL